VLVNAATGARFATITDGEGRFRLELLPPGEYAARCESAGMTPQVSPALQVVVGAPVELNFNLSVAGVTETLTVSGEPKLVDTEPAAVSSLIDQRAVTDLPLNGRRFTDLSLLTPGVTQDPRSLTSNSNGDMAFGGVRGFQTSFLVDGGDNNNAFFAQARGRYRAPYQFSNEVVQEFRVSANSYGAEQGRAGGAVVNVVTRSGSNDWHGGGFYFLRDSVFNAQHPFADVKPTDRQQQFGFTLGGPIRRNRTFFFAGFDQHLFDVPTLVRFLNGNTVLVPQPSVGYLKDGDYEASDKDLVFAAAAQLNTTTGTFRSLLKGNAGFAKVDTALSTRHYLSMRVSTSRYWGQNNVFFDPASPITPYSITTNGQENVRTETGLLSLTSNLTPRVVSHFRGQFSRDVEQSFANSTSTLLKIYSVTNGIGRSSILPRDTTEHRLHLAETLSVGAGAHALKFGGDGLFTWIANYFPSLSGGEYIYDTIKVNPWTFEPELAGLALTPLRAYAHRVPKYYVQNLGPNTSHPDTNEYAAFAQDTMRLASHLAVTLGVRYDLQTFSTKGLTQNPLWPMAGKVPLNEHNFSPRVGLSYATRGARPLVVRGGYGIFYTRVPQIYNSAVALDNGVTNYFLSLNHSHYYDRQVFPVYPAPAGACPLTSSACTPPPNLMPFVTTEISAFAPNFKTPSVEQASLGVQREIAHRLVAEVSYLYVHGEHMIRARDVNLPPPVKLTYPVFDETETNLLGYASVESFSNWQLTRTLTCPYPPCINPLARPIAQIGAINQYESRSSSVYNAATVGLRRQMSQGLYFRLAYTFGHATDDGPDALVAGRPVVVQNSYATSAEKGPSVTDQRHRFAFSWVAEPRPIRTGVALLNGVLNDWKASGVLTIGSGRPVDARVSSDPNQDGNNSNDRLPGVGRNSYLGPGYATTDVRISRSVAITGRLMLELIAESFNLFNRDNKRFDISDDGFLNSAGEFVQGDKTVGTNNFPGYYRRSASFMRTLNAYAPRQLQFAVRLNF
jgi:hypothetical protein